MGTAPIGFLVNDSKPAPLHPKRAAPARLTPVEIASIEERTDREISCRPPAEGWVEAPKMPVWVLSVVEDGMATTTSSMPAPEAQAALGPIGRIIGVFFSPKATF